jgi:nucleotide-binding universal stress UspA family protein
MDYAVELAKHLNAELLLYNCYYVPEFVHDSIIYLESPDLIEKESREDLERLQADILRKNKNLKVNVFCTSGITINEINEHAQKEAADLIVIGAHGAGYLQEKIVGSTASALIKNASIPVLVIDEHVKFKTPKNIVLASDFIETNNQKVLKPLKELIALFKSHLCILNVYKEPDIVPTFGEIAASFNLEKSLKHVLHTFFYTNNDEIVEGINHFIEKQKMDMVVMIARKHTLIERIFKPSNTKKMAFHSRVPFLVLHQ